jgi:hypothetical protein
MAQNSRTSYLTGCDSKLSILFIEKYIESRPRSSVALAMSTTERPKTQRSIAEAVEPRRLRFLAHPPSLRAHFFFISVAFGAIELTKTHLHGASIGSESNFIEEMLYIRARVEVLAERLGKRTFERQIRWSTSRASRRGAATSF